ncbi:MAG: asparaginase [Gemmatimonadales bacterium]|nr:asparaginase [Gemmatimonadales bacterium]NIN11106.1 asparaginase [Gemmatimonadales bacterium]NIN49703.1 asparaginase [Gemmatimonadales bacterium]NIP07167.1 asparaginase [Gemmatimonadales bacterium]NIQ99559.1 asparaginase [Gemmatimonadales bacterium]
MSDTLSRREFLGAASGLAAGAVLGPELGVGRGAPAVHIQAASKNVAVASGNGLRAVQRAGELMAQGVDTLDAAIEGVKIQELDPNDASVGYGGFPNEEGVVQLDASCMHGPSRRAGAVGALEGIKTPSVVAKYVLLYTDHIMLVGEGAKRFALSYGFKEENLLTDRAREAWLHWRANRGSRDDWLDVPRDERLTIREQGTINCNVVNSRGELSSVTTTSGLSWKIPGRVGDSPIIGAGQYTDNDVGAAGSTGRGEANIKVCGAFLTVEFMRRGMKPTDAALETLRRVIATSEPRLLDEQGRPTFGLTFYAVNKKGEFGAAAFTPRRYAAFDGETAAHHDAAYLFEREP